MSRQVIQIGRPIAKIVGFLLPLSAALALASVGAIAYGWDRLWNLMDPDPTPKPSEQRGEP